MAASIEYYSKRHHGLAGKTQDGLLDAEMIISGAVGDNAMRLEAIAKRDRVIGDGDPEYGVIVDTKLVLTGLELTSLPGETIARCTALEDIDCSNNFLELLPDEIILPRLQKLRCDNNPLRELPMAIGQCATLVEVFYGHCPDMVYPPQSFSENGSFPTVEAAAQSLRTWIRENPRGSKVKAARE